MISLCFDCIIFFFNDTATTEIYTLSLHDALPIWSPAGCRPLVVLRGLDDLGEHAAGRGGVHKRNSRVADARARRFVDQRSEEHTSELQSRQYLVCRLLLEKKKKKHKSNIVNVR